MAVREYGNIPTSSTGGLAVNPSSVTILAKTGALTNGNYECRFICGASTAANFFLERATSTLSTHVSDTSVQQQFIIFAPPNQSAEYVLGFRAEATERFRVRCSGITGTAAASIQTEKLV